MENSTNNELTFEVVQQFIETHKDSEEVKEIVKKLISPDLVDNYLSTEEGKKILQPRLDKYFSKGLETWKQNNLSSIIEEEINKKFPAETPEQKQLRELTQKVEALNKEKMMATLKAEALQELTSKGLPASMVDFLIADSPEATRERINLFATEYTKTVSETVNKEVESRFKAVGKTPNNESNTGGKILSKEDLVKMNYNERVKFYQENPEEYKRVMMGD